MTTTTAPATTAGRLRRHRTALLMTVAVLGALAVAALTAREPATSGDLDPGNPSVEGGRAVAEVLRDRGVDVTVVRDAAALEAQTVDEASTVVVTSAELLGQSTARRLADHATDGRLVVVEPAPGATAALGLDAAPASAVPATPVPAGCDDPDLAGLVLEVDRALTYDAPGCFPVDDGSLVARPAPGVTLLGAGDALRNDQVLRGDNAAAALRLLGQEPLLVWYVPDVSDLIGDDGVSLATLLPAWVRPALLLVTLAALALVAWRGRRLGPLAVEPLPVEVKSLETTRSRGRLYHRAGDREHAAATLRRATRRRLAGRLAVPVADEAALLAHLAARLDRPVAGLADLLGAGAPTPARDHDLITLAADLAALEEEVGHP